MIVRYGRKAGNQNIMLEIIYRIYKVADEEADEEMAKTKQRSDIQVN
ncbi:hypothetical protein [Ruminococcus sp.]|nr:hypothetical protein [Ruminococcus sp.]